jgi:hypothetical protein
MTFEGWQHVTSDYIILSQHVWESIINHIQNKYKIKMIKTQIGLKNITFCNMLSHWMNFMNFMNRFQVSII